MNLKNINGHYINVDLLSSGLIVDCGACHGNFTDNFIEKCGDNYRLVLIEPNITNFSILTDKYKNNHMFTLINAALVHESFLGKTVSFLDFGETHPEWGNITDLNIGSGRGTLNRYDVTTLKVSELLNTIKNSFIDFLKLDIEGEEYLFFKDLEEDTYTKIKQLSCEVHVKSQKDEIVDILTAHNFKCEFKNKAELYAYR